MALSTATKTEIRQAVKEAFEGLDIPTPDGCAIESQRITAVEKMIQDHDEFIDGNGKTGAKTTIPLMDERLKNLSKDFYEFRGRIEARTWAITLLVIGTLVTSILNLILKVP